MKFCVANIVPVLRDQFILLKAPSSEWCRMNSQMRDIFSNIPPLQKSRTSVFLRHCYRDIILSGNSLSLHQDQFLWQHSTNCMTLLHLAVSLGPHISVQFVAADIRFLLSTRVPSASRRVISYRCARGTSRLYQLYIVHVLWYCIYQRKI